MSTNRKWPPGTIKINVYLVPGTDEYEAFVNIKNKYQDEMDRRRKNNRTNQLCKTDTGNCELIRGSLLALDKVQPEHLPNFINSASKPKGRHTTKQIQEADNQTDSDEKLDDQATLLH